MRRLCDLWIERDDDKAETSRMGDNDDEVVQIGDDEEVDTMDTKMDSSGHKPRVDGRRGFQQDHTGTWKRTTRLEWYFKKTKMPFLVVLPPAYIHVRGSFKAPPEYLSTNSVSSLNPTTVTNQCPIS